MTSRTVKSPAQVESDKRQVDRLRPRRDQVQSLLPEAEAEARRIIELSRELADAIDAWQRRLNEGLRIATAIWGPRYAPSHLPWSASDRLSKLRRQIRIDELAIPLPLELLDDGLATADQP